MKKMSSNRNRFVAPRNVVNTKMLYTFYILKELAKGETIFGNKILEVFRNKFQNAERPFPVSSWATGCQTRSIPYQMEHTDSSFGLATR